MGLFAFTCTLYVLTWTLRLGLGATGGGVFFVLPAKLMTESKISSISFWASFASLVLSLMLLPPPDEEGGGGGGGGGGPADMVTDPLPLELPPSELIPSSAKSFSVSASILMLCQSVAARKNGARVTSACLPVRSHVHMQGIYMCTHRKPQSTKLTLICDYNRREV